MPDILTPEERAAIDAFPQERIQRIPMGRSATAHSYMWVERKGPKSGGKLMASVPSSWKAVSQMLKARNGVA